MKKAGRAFLSVLVVAVILAAGAVFFFMAGSSPSSVANDFMVALAHGDVKQLGELSYIEGDSPQQLEDAWKVTLDRGKYYRFFWRVKNSVQPTPDQATVTMDFQRNADQSSSYPEDYALNLVRVGGKWKVDVRQISRTMFPGLPR